MEEIWALGDDELIIMPRTSEGLFLLQRVRDEAHRFAITFHRSKRSRADDEFGTRRGSVWDPPGAPLVTAFGWWRTPKAASVEEDRCRPGISPTTAKNGIPRRPLAVGRQESDV